MAASDQQGHKAREVDVLIDKRELLEKARERKLNLQIVEKDYVLGWLLYGMKDFDELAFKGGTALSKIYFPKRRIDRGDIFRKDTFFNRADKMPRLF